MSTKIRVISGEHLTGFHCRRCPSLPFANIYSHRPWELQRPDIIYPHSKLRVYTNKNITQEICINLTWLWVAIVFQICSEVCRSTKLYKTLDWIQPTISFSFYTNLRCLLWTRAVYFRQRCYCFRICTHTLLSFVITRNSHLVTMPEI